MNVFVLLNTKEDSLKNVGNRAVLDHSIFFTTMEVNGAPNSLVTNVLSNIFHCVWYSVQCVVFVFLVNYPFKLETPNRFLHRYLFTFVQGSDLTLSSLAVCENGWRCCLINRDRKMPTDYIRNGMLYVTEK